MGMTEYRVTTRSRGNPARPELSGCTGRVLLDELVPRPQKYQLIYHGVFAANAKLRKRVVAYGRPPAPESDHKPSPKKRKRHNPTWAELMRRGLDIDSLECPKCKSRMRFVASILRPAVIRRILDSLDLPAAPILPAPARAPPDDDLIFDDRAAVVEVIVDGVRVGDEVAFGVSSTNVRRLAARLFDGRRRVARLGVSPAASAFSVQPQCCSVLTLTPISVAYSRAVRPLSFQRSTRFIHSSRVAFISTSDLRVYTAGGIRSGTRFVERIRPTGGRPMDDRERGWSEAEPCPRRQRRDSGRVVRIDGRPGCPIEERRPRSEVE